MANPNQPGFPYTVIEDPVKPKPEEMKLEGPQDRPPRCPKPACMAFLTPVDQNASGDILFECTAGGWATHDYHAVYRVATGRYTHRYDPVIPTPPPAGWLPPLLHLADGKTEPAPVAEVVIPERPERPDLPVITPGREEQVPVDIHLRPALEKMARGTGTVVITPARLAEEFKAGGSMTEIAARYGITVADVEASIRAAAIMAGTQGQLAETKTSRRREESAPARRPRRRRRPRLNAQKRTPPPAEPST